ncbi:hypothetical protein BDR04DRAFT_802851 [Suillus decipiens]|nr:hypothetical protein BDR04DRAFT_802851 [Suillus decipiens]
MYSCPPLNLLIQIYDYACSLHEEWTFLRRSEWRNVKALYIAARYLPFILLTVILYQYFTPNENPDNCRMLSNICSGLSILSAICSEGFFVLRTCALWNNNRILLAAMAVTIPTFIGVSLGTSFGCYRSSGSLQLFIPYIFLSAFELGLLILTLIPALPAMQSWWIDPGHMYVVLVKHNIFYYICGFSFSVANILVSLLLQLQ